LPATLAAQQAGFTRVIVPLRQAGEAKLVAGIDVSGIASITQLVAFLQGEPMPVVDPIEVISDPAGKHAERGFDLADMAGQAEAKWACEVAAAGRHHMLFHGPPGVGKTMLAERVPGLLPDLDLHDSLEVSAVHSLAGFNLAAELITRPPYSDPHHSASVASIVGGGQRMARPGAISCAHKGVLFLDDCTESQIHPHGHGRVPFRDGAFDPVDWSVGHTLTLRAAGQPSGERSRDQGRVLDSALPTRDVCRVIQWSNS
jgi:magnesium chelatase family protein